jgi:hypothetical protein
VQYSLSPAGLIITESSTVVSPSRFPAIVDTAVAVSTLMLVALGEQTGTPGPHRDLVYRYTNSNEATVGASPDAECKSQGHTVWANQCAGTDLCISKT